MFSYPCFISYRNFSGDQANAFINQFFKCLSEELEPLVGTEPFLDRTELKPGHDFPAYLASKICQSACMIIIWSPQYFNLKKSWCSREFHAMHILEQKRLSFLKGEDKSHRLIIPIIYRGPKNFPKKLDYTKYLDFSNFTLYPNKPMIKNPNFHSPIKDLAEYINERMVVLCKNKIFPIGCDKFFFPEERDTLKFIKPYLTGIQNFVFRN